MVTTLFLIRHGQTAGNGPKRYKGWLDVPLSSIGARQMRKTADLLKVMLRETGGNSLKAVYASDLSRAVKSASIISRPHGLKPVIVPELRERNFGKWENMTFDEIKQKYPDAFDRWAKDPLRFSPIGGETTVQVRDRVVKAVRTILRRHKGEAIAIVAHGGVNRVLLCSFLGISLRNIFRLEQDFAALNLIEFWDRTPIVKLINGRPELC